VIQKILASHDGVTVFTGAAGTGKTWCAARIAEAIHAQGHKAWSLAPTASAVEELRKGGFVGAKTIALALIKEMDDKGGAQPGDFILVDESGMVGSQDMLHLLEYAHRRQARVILQGDRQQIMAVSCGDALATIEDETAVTRASLLEVRRQVPKQYKNAVKKLRRDPVGGLDALVAMGAVEQCAATNLSDELAREYFAETDKVGANGKKKDVLIVAGTHKIIDRVTTSIREERIRRGEIDTTKEVTRISLQSTQWTEAEKRLTGEYEENFVVRFQKPLGEVFERNAKAEVVGVNVKTGKIKLRHPETKTEIEVAPSVISKDCEVMRKADIKVAAGDKIMFQVNRKFPRADGKMRRCVNGEVAIVHSVDTESGDIQLKDGRILRKEFEDFCLAYANTAHKSQGKTVDSVIVAGDGLTKELFYVAVTRGRKSVKIFTQNVVDLAHKVSISGARRSATSFARDYFEDVMMRRAHDKQREVAAQGEAERAVVQAVTISPAPAAQIATLQGRSGPGGANQTRNVGGI
jgi:ATP-dependent exoDNAse (exonuclease V) alpha subunit